MSQKNLSIDQEMLYAKKVLPKLKDLPDLNAKAKILVAELQYYVELLDDEGTTALDIEPEDEQSIIEIAEEMKEIALGLIPSEPHLLSILSNAQNPDNWKKVLKSQPKG